MIVESGFRPAWWLPGPHLQTIWASRIRRRPRLRTRRQRLELPDGDFVDLDWTLRESGAVVCVFHGLEGSLRSRYAAGMLKALDKLEYRAVLMHFRGCSGEPNRLARSYHSGDTEDIRFLLQTVRKLEPQAPLAAIGYSLGGNALLKYLGEEGPSSPLTTAVAVSVPLELDKAARQLQYGFSRLYQHYLLSSLKRSVQRKRAILSRTEINLTLVDQCADFWEFDDRVTAPLHGFANVHDYYRRASSRQYLRHIRTRTLIVHAADDPFVSSEVIPSEKELSDAVTFELSCAGGHVGFVGGDIPGWSNYWLEDRIGSYLSQTIPVDA